MTEPMSGHTDEPSSNVLGLLLEEPTLFKTGPPIKEVRINQIPTTTPLKHDTPHFVSHQQVHSMATVVNNSTNTQINACCPQHHEPSEADNILTSSVPLVIPCHPEMILI